MTRIANAYEEDVAPTKINLSLPGFREDEGKIFVPPTVRYVEKQMRNESMLAAEALPVWGDDKFLEAGIKFAYGTDEKRYRRDHVSAVQAISLTGALRLAGTFLSRIPSRGRQVYLPSPSTDEETRTLRDAGLEIRYYRFLDRKTGNVDFDGLREDILTAPERSAILLFVTGSMPTGLDLSLTQWKSLITLLHQRNLIPLVVMAFQGLVTGDPSQDAEPLRLMAHEGLPVVLCQIFDATMGLYADSPSIVSIVTQSEESKERVDGQLRGVARGLYLHPSPWGAFVARAILSDSKLHPAWLVEIKAMSDRLRSVREKLYDLLATKFKTPGTWSHIKKSVGMYCTTLLPPAVNDSLTLKRHIHLLPHGSISLGTLNSPKIEALARAIDSVVLAYNRELEEAQAQQLAMQIALAAAREAAAREEEEAEAQAAEDEDRMLLEQDLASAIEAQTRAEEDERRREEEEKGLEEAVRRAAERAETARAAEAILASITAGHAF
ncbi:pyridoxal phosphate-dependent transferase [Papiliotrema laurentii]|uniref:Pyridoxal phosphate-dependent transferase n=1 Tax=Papiliotrema laurentii TaxID=5418 RepID=A0AAD9D2C7_PAPLA|nr:pyridoxal phosphate-dependent transferase [Papiliotrema laurentii]